MIRPLSTLAAVTVIGFLGAGPLSAASPVAELPGDDIAAQQAARLLHTETLGEGESRWRVARLQEFVDLLDTDRTEALEVEVVEDVTGPALAVRVDTASGGVDEVCVVAAADGEPVSAERPCRTA